MEKKVIDFIQKHNILSSVHRVVLAISGGADSMAMAHILLRRFPGHSYVIAHVNHGLRPEADEEEQFVSDFAHAYGVEFCCYRADIATLAKERKQGIEETGREERYRFFRSLGADRILTAHHKDDWAETVLFHVVRGCGIQGLCGIEPCKDDLGRPLLCVTKKEILEYCEKERINYKTDSSNEDVKYTRNRIRKNVLPLLKEINPNVTESLARLSESVVDDHDFLESTAYCYFQKYSHRTDEHCFLRVSEVFTEQPAMARRMIRFAVQDFGASVDFGRTEEIRFLKNGKSLPVTTGLWVYREKDGYLFGPKRDLSLIEEEVVLPLNGKAETDHFVAEVREPNFDDVYSVHCCGIFDRREFLKSPMIRTRRPGDYVVLPDGRTKKLSDYFIDEKIPVWKRDSVLLLAVDSQVLWVVGHRFFAEKSKSALVVNIRVKS